MISSKVKPDENRSFEVVVRASDVGHGQSYQLMICYE